MNSKLVSGSPAKSLILRTISTFSCDIATPTAQRLRGLRRGSRTALHERCGQIEELVEPGVAVGVGAYRLQHRPHDFHVFLRHRLLRQPQGFEGLSYIRVNAPTDHLALLEREYEGVGSHINFHAGCTPSIALMDNGCHFVTRIDQIHYLEADRLPRGKPSPPELAYPFMAAIDTSEIQSRMA